MRLSVIVPTHGPDPRRLARTFAALHAQRLPAPTWEILLVDNASSPPIAPPEVSTPQVATRLVREPQLGLTSARRRGIAAARGEYLVLVDDDNVLAPDYLERVVQHFDAHPKLGALGGKNLAEFEQPPPSWWKSEFNSLIACRDLGIEPQFAGDCRDPRNGRRLYPQCAPVGAGMALRRSALQAWLDESQSGSISDRRGTELTSGGDNDIVFTLLRGGWQVAYFPDLVLTHLIPAARIRRDYLARLNRGIAESWIRVLEKHQANPWPPISPWSVAPRIFKAWFTHRAWSGPAAYVRWQGACGHFEGRAS